MIQNKNRILIVGLIFAMSFSLTTSAFACDFRQKDVTVTWLSEDTTTKGNWVNTYGSYAYILPNTPCGASFIEVPLGCFSKPCCYCGCGYNLKNLQNPPYSWTYSQYLGLTQGYWKASSPYWDEYFSAKPKITYTLEGTRTKFVQYPTWAWSWGNGTQTQTDPRECYYPKASYWKLACWDDGGDRGTPLHGWFDINLVIPKGNWKLSVYAYDYEMWSRSTQLYIIMDSSGHTLATKQIGGTAFDNGVYETFQISCSANTQITMRVYNDAGTAPILGSPSDYPQDKTLNVLVSGVFLDATGR
jgi:hypothetical protein